MLKRLWRIRKIIISSYLLVAVIFSLSFLIQDTQAMASASDRLSLTWPGAAASHTITFRLTKNLPANGKITITPAPGFFIEPFFDYTQVDIATAQDINGTFSDREIDSLADSDLDGVSAVASSSSGSIQITMNSSFGIDADTIVRIELGALADFGATGTSQIVNPDTVGSYRIEAKTYDENDIYLERAVMMVAIIEPVRLGNYVPKVRFDPSPAGVLTYGTTQTILSMHTNYRADCRWSNTASTSYAAMTHTFPNTGFYYHSGIITGITDGSYFYYVRCYDLFGGPDDTDFLIKFSIAGFEGQGGNEDTEGSPGSGGTGAGSGGGSGGSVGNVKSGGVGEMLPFPSLPNTPLVSFRGYAYPGLKVKLLKDGLDYMETDSDSSGKFELGIKEIDQGVYTFSLLAVDNAGRMPAAQSYTFYVKDGTQTNLYNIYFPPTIAVPKPSFEIGDNLVILGQSAASSNIDLWLYPKVVGGVKDESILKYKGISAINGDWNFALDTDKLVNGPYLVKAMSSLASFGSSDFSKTLDLMVGGELVAQTCAGADLNGDGKVNITDFSILLYWWGKKNDCADQNHDGTVNLIDFSIMMYNWTG